MGKQFRWDRIAAGGALRDDLAQLGGIPEDDAGGEQVHAGDAIMLPFAGTVPDLAATVEADGPLQGVVGLEVLAIVLFPFLKWSRRRWPHRLLPSGELGRGMAQIRADRGGGGSPGLHGSKRRKDGETPAITKRSRVAAETARPLRQGAGTGP